MTDQELDALLAARRARLAETMAENRRQRLAREQAAQDRADHAAFWSAWEQSQELWRAVLPMRGRR